ncbi:unnamed protein product [Dovyalis caffra]|uniref:Ribosomal protein S15 n=1 Tax=Dovyalis caffra TaxID=77055 RepID=A0AAV1RQK7_9ROSI|nr:unnamed protein product [Dovyalis caffra]
MEGICHTKGRQKGVIKLIQTHCEQSSRKIIERIRCKTSSSTNKHQQHTASPCNAGRTRQGGSDRSKVELKPLAPNLAIMSAQLFPL